MSRQMKTLAMGAALSLVAAAFSRPRTLSAPRLALR